MRGKIRKNFICVILFCCLIQGCSISQNNPNASQVAFATEIISEQILATADPDLQEEYGLNSMPTPDKTPTFSINNECWFVKPMEPGDIQQGSLLLKSLPTHQYYLFHLNTFTLEPISTVFDERFVSAKKWYAPDGQRFASIFDDDQLYLFENGNGKYFGLPESDLYRITFLEDGRLLLERSRTEYLNKRISPKDIHYVDRIYILDPSTGIFTYKTIDLPELGFLVHQSIPIQYSSDLKYVVYLTYLQDTAERIRVIDLETGEIVLSKIDIDENMLKEPDMVPGWIPGTHTLSVIFWKDRNYQEANYYSIDLDGHVSQLTEFVSADLFATGIGVMQYPQWSPDGKNVVFDVVNENFPYIYNIESRTAKKICFQNISFLPNRYVDVTNNPSYFSATSIQYECLSSCQNEAAKYNIIFSYYRIDMQEKMIYSYPQTIIEELLEKETGSREYDSFGELGVIY